jgi:hypothetical protein
MPKVLSMPTATKKKTTPRAKNARTTTPKLSQPKSFFVGVRHRIRAFMARRPHRSFRRTYRRDYVRSLELPGYWAFTLEVWRILRRQWRTFALLALVYALGSALLVGLASQDVYSQLNDTLDQAGGAYEGKWGQVGKAGLLFLTTISGGMNGAPTESQQIYGALIALMTWLTTVWLLRNMLAGSKVRLRDGLYASGSPILSTFLVALMIGVQLIPIMLAAIGYGAAQASGLLNGGVEAMLFWVAAGLLAVLSLYWVTSTIIALVVVTLPGMYPWQAIRTAGDLVVGRRTRILLRLLWMLFVTLLAWALIVIPLILLDNWLASVWPVVGGLAVIPIVVLTMSSATVVWLASYVYILYRKVVEDDAKPA